MVYIYRKTVGDKSYFYLRASARRDGKIFVKDIKYLGNDVNQLKENLKSIPSAYSGQIRKTYKTLNRFIEANLFLEKARLLKLKKDLFLGKGILESVESCRIHWDNVFRRLDPLTKQELIKNFIIEFAFNTTSIEGNTITLKEAQNLLNNNLTPKNKTLREIYDLQNTEKVFMHIYQNPPELSHEIICLIHGRLLENIDNRKGYRTADVRVFKANFKSTPAPYVKTDMDLLMRWYDKHKNKFHPFVLAVIFHHKFEKIHPFMDGNGRTGRMLQNMILLRNGYPPVIIRKQNRSHYLSKLNKADKSNPLDANSSDYEDLIGFSADEMVFNYWNNFL